MIKFNLKNCVKNKNILSLLSNYYLFTTSFEYILSSPQFTLVFLSMKQKAIYNLKKFLFYKLKELTVFSFNNKNALFSKRKFQFLFVTDFLCILLVSIFFQILNLILKQKFSFIPSFSRLTNFNSFLTIRKNNINCSSYILRFNIKLNNFVLFKSTFKVLKKFIYDRIFIEYFLQLILIFARKKIFTKTTQLLNILSFVYFSQLDFYLFTLLINKVKFKVKLNFKKTLIYIKKALKMVNKIFLFFNFKKKKLFFTKRKKSNFFSFNYKRINYTFLLIFSASFSLFSILKKEIFLFLSLNFNGIKTFPANCFNFLGFDLKIKKVLYEKKIFFNLNLKKEFMVKIVPLILLQNKFINFGLLNIFNKPLSFNLLTNYLSKNLFYWYLNFFFGFLIYYKNCSNFKKFILSVYYICKWSLLFTLAKKHKKSVKNILSNYFIYFNDLFFKNNSKLFSKNNLKLEDNFTFSSYIFNYQL